MTLFSFTLFEIVKVFLSIGLFLRYPQQLGLGQSDGGSLEIRSPMLVAQTQGFEPSLLSNRVHISWKL